MDRIAGANVRNPSYCGAESWAVVQQQFFSANSLGVAASQLTFPGVPNTLVVCYVSENHKRKK